MIKNYQVHGKGSSGEAALLAVNKVARDEILTALDRYARVESAQIGTIIGVSVDGVIFTPTENWSRESKDAFTDIHIVPWVYIKELLGHLPDGTTEEFLDHRGHRH